MGDMSRPRSVGRACPVRSDPGRSKPGDMLIHCATSGTRPGACSFLTGDMLIVRGKEWAYGAYVQASGCGEGMSRELRSCQGQAWFMLILSAGHAHSLRSTEDPPGRTCPFLMARPGHRGYMSGPWRQRRACPAAEARSAARSLKPARGHCVLLTAEDGPQVTPRRGKQGRQGRQAWLHGPRGRSPCPQVRKRPP